MVSHTFQDASANTFKALPSPIKTETSYSKFCNGVKQLLADRAKAYCNGQFYVFVLLSIFSLCKRSKLVKLVSFVCFACELKSHNCSIIVFVIIIRFLS